MKSCAARPLRSAGSRRAAAGSRARRLYRSPGSGRSAAFQASEVARSAISRRIFTTSASGVGDAQPARERSSPPPSPRVELGDQRGQLARGTRAGATRLRHRWHRPRCRERPAPGPAHRCARRSRRLPVALGEESAERLRGEASESRDARPGRRAEPAGGGRSRWRERARRHAPRARQTRKSHGWSRPGGRAASPSRR